MATPGETTMFHDVLTLPCDPPCGCTSERNLVAAELMSILRSPELLLNVTGTFCDQNFDDEAAVTETEMLSDV